MFTLNIAANTAEELRLKLLDIVDHFKLCNVQKSPEPPKEIKPVISQAQIEENVKNAPIPPIPEQPSIEEVRTALKELRERKGAGAVRELLKAYGADSLTQLKEEDYLGALARAKTEV